MLASAAERDSAAQRLQLAFAEHRLTDEEFDRRIQLALTARTNAELDQLVADLPAATAVTGTGQLARPATKRGALALAIKGSVTRAGHWRVPRRLTCVAYKGSGRLDLSAAELTAPVTTIRAIAYKSTIDVVLPPGARIEATGVGVSSDYPAGGQQGGGQAPSGPTIRIRGVAYKGGIDVTGTARALPG